MANEILVPVQEDLTQSEHKLDIVRGLEGLIRMDKTIATGVTLEEGSWAVLNNNDELTAPAAVPVANTYPVWAGNADGRSDVHATGKATILVGGRFIYRTTKYVAGVYNVGSSLTVKAAGIPEAAGLADLVLARVHKAPTNGIMEIEVL